MNQKNASNDLNGIATRQIDKQKKSKRIIKKKKICGFWSGVCHIRNVLFEFGVWEGKKEEVRKAAIAVMCYLPVQKRLKTAATTTINCIKDTGRL